jgi:predicted lipoprotein with Yx(FWY)xxD motif
MKALRVVLAAATLFVAGCATTSDAPAKADGGVLVGPNGMTLYTFDRDTAGDGKSVCLDKCAVLWPPFMASSGSVSGNWSIVTRPDGAKQWAFKGKPLYYWIKDQKPGDRTGDGFNKIWQLARP